MSSPAHGPGHVTKILTEIIGSFHTEYKVWYLSTPYCIANCSQNDNGQAASRSRESANLLYRRLSVNCWQTPSFQHVTISQLKASVRLPRDVHLYCIVRCKPVLYQVAYIQLTVRDFFVTRSHADRMTALDIERSTRLLAGQWKSRNGEETLGI